MRLRPIRAALLAGAALPCLAAAQAPRLDRDGAAAVVDSVFAAAAPGWRTAAGMTVAVVRGRDTLVMKGYGSADLELDVPTPDRAAYEIGSVTRRCTDRTPKGVPFRGRAADYAGEYRGIGRGWPMTFGVAADSSGPGLLPRVNGGPAQPLTYYGGETFGRGPNRYHFVREGRAGGRVTTLRADNRVVYSIAAREP